MQYVALYRRYRPDTFSGVIGQNHIVRTLKNQINSGRVSHAYLFCGTKGTGKTSTAKIFAKAINCTSPDNGEPCGECKPCTEIAAQIGVNVIEIDAASNNGVDNIRDLREEVKYAPVNGKYKVYIIDEVHMLSAGAFNALLKTLEEPPAHVVFILATTDPQKIPATIHSRCQRFDFRRISATQISEQLMEYMNKENVEIDREALDYIALISDGAMRDALNILDQCATFFYNERVTLEKVREITGSVDSSVFFELTGALNNNDASSCINIINGIIVKGRDIPQFVTEFIVHLRNLLIAETAPSTENTMNFSDENKKLFIENSGNIPISKIIEFITLFSQLQGKLKYASNDRILLEVCCIQICNPVEIRQPQKNQSEKKQAQKPNKNNTVINETVKPKAVPDDFKAVLAGWNDFAAGFKGMEAGFLKETKAGYLDNNFLFIVCDSASAVSILKKKEDLITAKLFEAFGKEFQLNFVFKDIYTDMHRKRFGAADNFDYSEEKEIANIKNTLNIDITVE